MEKKNTVLLTVIAIATLLVAVIGATFAYFTAQRGDGAQADITVTTSTSDSIVYGSFNALVLKATQQNFGQNLGSQRATTEGEIKLTASDNDSREDTADYCYTSTIKISENGFGYKPQAEGVEETVTNQPELILSLYYNGNEYKQQLNDVTYTTIEGPKKVCDQENGETSEDKCKEEETIAGYDITTIGNVSGEPPLEPTTTNFKVPVWEENSDKPFAEQSFTHHIKTEDTSGEVTAKWKASITFVNYDFDQQYNTDKKFIAIWEFTPVDCESGEPIVQETP